MRRLMIAATLAAVALGTAAGCADNSTPGNGGTTPASAAATSAGDATAEVCTEATAASTTAATTLQAKYTELAPAVASGDQAKIQQVATDLAKTAGEWSAKLTQLSTRPVKPELKQALTDGATTIGQLAASAPTTTMADAQAKLVEFSTKLAAACD